MRGVTALNHLVGDKYEVYYLRFTHARLSIDRGKLYYECLENHLINVTLASMRIANRLMKGLSDKFLKALKIAASLHDISKVFNYILQKSS